MTKHLLAPDLIKLGWERGLAEAAEETLKGLAELQAELDTEADAAVANDLPTFDLAQDETSSVPNWSQYGTSAQPVLRTR